MTPEQVLIEAQGLCRKFGWDPEHGGIVPQIGLIIVLSKIVQEIQESSRMLYKHLVQREA
jgi:hypothetical protein